MTERTTCVVAGGGPAGMVLGLLLARAGVDVTVLEKHGDFLRDFRGDTVHPSTLQLLDELGLSTRFAQLPQSTVSEIAFPYPDGSRMVLGDLSRLKTPHPYIAMVPQWDLLDLIAEAGSAEQTFTLRMNTEATELVHESGRVAGVRYRDTEGTGELRADLTVAADGRWSLTREATSLHAREFPVPMDVWWFRLPKTDDEQASALTPVMRSGHLGVVIPREDFFQVAYMAPKGLDERFRAEGIAAFRARISGLLPQFADRLDALETMADVKHLDVRLNRLDRWYTNGLLCIGDAAHAMSPLGGVGINLAVQDAVAAATLLADPLRAGTVGPRDLARVQRRRMLPTRLVQRLQRILHRVVVVPVLDKRRDGPPKPIVAALRRVPALSVVPARLIGIGFRPERAPAFARRAETTAPQ